MLVPPVALDMDPLNQHIDEGGRVSISCTAIQVFFAFFLQYRYLLHFSAIEVLTALFWVRVRERGRDREIRYLRECYSQPIYIYEWECNSKRKKVSKKGRKEEKELRNRLKGKGE